MKYVLYVLVGVLAGFVLAGGLLFVMRAPAGDPIVLQPAPTERPIAVHVIGAVARPGLYEFPEGARVQDAIDAAGGLLAEADPDAMNLAALLEDGQQLSVPYGSGAAPVGSSGSTTSGLPGITPTAASTASSVDLVCINTATVEELDALPGIGPTTAQKIVDYRNENGPFNVVDDLDNVQGIGINTIDNMRDLITADCS